ncbi:hypothetical protein PIB30_016491 [Stylosanthes scabra]|uniref:Uncharacterized protein n=1 Tax=Stylosanthes scabra TaxID=79078 RepID=A0ABU6Z3X9_9FABA|nr:hypothetical protein [Stylosanthes scabra]
MGKKRSCQDVKVPRPLNEVESRLYGWVEEAVLTQPSVVESDSFPEFRRNFSLMEDSGTEGDYVLEAAGPSDRVPFRADEGALTFCGQLHLNGWGFILAFEKVCLHYGFRPTIRLFFYIYDVLIPPTTMCLHYGFRPTTTATSLSELVKAVLLAKKQSSKRERAKIVDLEGEEGLKEDHSTDLQWKRQKKKAKEDGFFDRVLGDDSASKHEVDPIKVAFSESFNYRKALNAGLTSALVREALAKMPLEQLLGESYHFSAKSLACFQVGVETSLAAKVKAEKELSAALDQIEILKGERDSALAFLPFKEKADNLKDQLSEKTSEYQSALDRITQLEEDNRVLKTQLVAAEKQKLGTEVTEMCQETLDICLDQVSHFCPGVDFSAITLKSRWDPKGRRIYVPQESDVEEEPPQAEEVVLEQCPEATTQVPQPAAGDVAGVSGECPT